MDSDGIDASGNKPSPVVEMYKKLGYMYQYQIDRIVPYIGVRWTILGFLAVFYFVRVFLLQGWYIITYALGIYILNLLIAFLTPKIDPALQQMEEEEEEEGPRLPTKRNEEFKPFMRRLPEFKFWHSATKAFLISIFCTFFDAFNIPVFWPILVMYFLLLTFVTMKKQIKHMIKYKYIPFTRGKTVYQGKEEKSAVTTSDPRAPASAPASASAPPATAPAIQV